MKGCRITDRSIFFEKVNYSKSYFNNSCILTSNRRLYCRFCNKKYYPKEFVFHLICYEKGTNENIPEIFQYNGNLKNYLDTLRIRFILNMLYNYYYTKKSYIEFDLISNYYTEWPQFFKPFVEQVKLN